MKKVTNRNDVARRAGVSGATVSRVFNNPGSVTFETRDRVLKVCEELNYHPNIIASNFVKRRSGNIGVVIPQIPNVHIFSVYYFSELLSGIGEALNEKGYDLVLFFHKVDQGNENDYLKYFKGGKVDGCILLGTRKNDEGLRKLVETQYKFCLVNNNINISNINFIDVDNVQGSYEAVSHLIKKGHSNIAFLNGPQFYSNSIDRLEGYRKALQEGGIPIKSEYLLEGNYGKKSGFLACNKILELEKPPTAVFAGSDRMAAGLIQGLKEKGLKVPRDIAVVGYDDSDTARLIDPQLTTVRIPFFELGQRCVYEFLDIINSNSDKSFGIFIKPELVVRESG